MTARRLRDGSPFESIAGYSRAVRQGNHVCVSGTTALGPDGVLYPGDTYAQTAEAIRRALGHRVRCRPTRRGSTRLLLAPDCDWRDAARAHGEFFAEHGPANTTYSVAGFIPDGMLAEIELDAVITSE
jgi:enamine deaminase RidA (YjgF/YER057c/UK114 family)